jgi:TRAP-type C4-dicarboxylate transport system substrate-binding protein
LGFASILPARHESARKSNQAAMLRNIIKVVIAAFILWPVSAMADPIKLTLSFFTSDRSNIYQNSIKPFVDAVNEEGRGLIEIEIFFSGAISKVQSQQPLLVADGTVDLAIIVPGQLPDRFTNNAVIELPGLYRDSREASTVFTKLVAANALSGYSDYVVVGAFVSENESIHSRKPINSIGDLKDLVVRTNNRMEAAALEKLGAVPILMPINQTTAAVSRGNIDAATLPPSMLFEFGVGRVTSHHFMLRLGGAPTALVMNRKKFDSLPPKAQAIIRKYGSGWLSEVSAAGMGKIDALVREELKADARRNVVIPSSAEMAVAQAAFESVISDWSASSAHNLELLTLAKSELSKLRSGQ